MGNSSIIDLKKAGGEEFDAYFGQLNIFQRMAFVKQHKQDIAALSNADILVELCEQGYFNALLPLIKTGDARADEQIMNLYHPEFGRIKVSPSKDDEREILKYAAKKMDIVRFLREKTTLFSGLTQRPVPFILLMYEYATPEITDYLFEWICRKHIPMKPSVGQFLFGKASPKIIHDYLMKVGCFSGTVFVYYTMLRNLALRTDIDAEDKHELLLLAVNQLQVRTEVIHRLRTEGLLDF